MTDCELLQQTLDLLNQINKCSLPPIGIPIPAEIDDVMEAIKARLTQPEPVATLFGSLPVYDTPTQPEAMLNSLQCACGASWTCSDGVLKYNPTDKPKPVAWVDSLERARPECVTDFKYLSVQQVRNGEQHNYIPLYTAPARCTCNKTTDWK